MGTRPVVLPLCLLALGLGVLLLEAGLNFALQPIIVGFIAVFFVAMTNWALVEYLRAITAKDDLTHHRPTAIALSAALFIALIALYATIFGIEAPTRFCTDDTVDRVAGQFVALGWYSSAVKAFYYSVVTVTTLGYGDISPTDNLGRITASFEALNGLVAFGIFTGAITAFFTSKNNLPA